MFALLVLVLFLWRPAGAHVRAASLLTRFSTPDATTAMASMGSHPVDDSDFTVKGPRGAIPARLYVPRDVTDGPGIVIVHGVHHTGIEEPRLMRFARTIAAAGVVVLTPEIAELSDYHVDARSIETIGASVHALCGRVGRAHVGVMGLSFGGGLSLLAAADPRFAPEIGFVVAVGAHDDLSRVSHFFATNEIAGPDGIRADVRAHEYGPLVVVYSHIDDFFPKDDVPVAKDAMRLWLWEKRDEARSKLPLLSPDARTKMQRLFDAKLDAIGPEILAQIEKNEPMMAAVSPHGRIGNVHAPVFLLHGSGDTVIPSSETLWLANDLPPGTVHELLVTPALVHVELEGEPPIAQKWALVHFMATVLAEADR